MKTMTFSHYTIKDIDPSPWRETWDNLMKFGKRMGPKLAPLGFKMKLRKVIMDDATQDNLMMANMVTVDCPELKLQETPIENIIGLELDFTPCADCVTPQGQEFPCRTFNNLSGEPCQALPEEFFMETALRVAFSAQHVCGCDCGSCASGCGSDNADDDLGKWC